MKETLYYNGRDYEKFKNAFAAFFDEKDIINVLHVLTEYKEELLSEEEIFEIYDEERDDYHLGYNKLLHKMHYHVNIKGVSIVCLQIICEIFLQSMIAGQDITSQEIPIIPSIVELKKYFNKLSEENGEFCVCKEIECQSGNRVGWKDINNSSKECINNNLNCSFNQQGICNLNQQELEKILNVLVQKQIIEKNSKGYKIVM